jgi:hypothetical protein
MEREKSKDLTIETSTPVSNAVPRELGKEADKEIR